MSEQIRIAQVSIEDTLDVVNQVPEFDISKPHLSDDYQARMENKDPVAFVGYLDEKPAGFIIAYDKYGDGSWYCWRAGVIPNFRRKGIHSALMSEFEKTAKQKEYRMVKIVTRNNRREMLSYLVNNDWCFIEMFPRETIEDSRMLLVKQL